MRNATGFDGFDDLAPYNPDILSKYYKRLSIALNLTGLSVLVYFVLLALKLDDVLHQNFLWSYGDIPIGIALGSLSFAGIYFVSAEHQRILNPGKRLLQVSILIFAMCAFGFIVLQNLKNDNLINLRSEVIFAPLFLELIIILFGLIFSLPGLFDQDNEYFGEAAVFIIDFFLLLTFLVMLSLKLDENLTLYYTEIFLCLFGIIGVHLIFLLSKMKQKGFLNTLKDVLLLLFIFIFCLLLVLTINHTIKISWLVVFSPLLLLVLAFEWHAMGSFLTLMTAKTK